MFTNAHRVEVEVGADAPTSAPPSEAAADAPPESADAAHPTTKVVVSGPA
jgi:hypothetical protein